MLNPFRRKSSAPAEQRTSDLTDDAFNDNTEKTEPQGLAPEDPPRGPSVAEIQLKKFEQLHEYDPNLPGKVLR
jgi:hypothetical protein